MKNLHNRKLFELFELFELFDKKVKNYSLFDKFLIHYLNPSLPGNVLVHARENIIKVAQVIRALNVWNNRRWNFFEVYVKE
jgi:hypothetical protein